MLLFVVAACMIPLLIQGRLMAQSSRQMQVERRIIDVQNQCQILSNKMSRNGYLGNSGVDTSGTDTELSMLADIFNGPDPHCKFRLPDREGYVFPGRGKDLYFR